MANSRPEGIFTQQVMQQLEAVFERMQEPLILELCLDEKAITEELRSYMEELARLTPKLTVRKSTEGAEHVPLVRVLRSDGSNSVLAFHGVPGGHEFTSFIMGLYNVAGPGQALDGETMDRKRWCTALAGSYLNKRKAAEMRLFQGTTVSIHLTA